MSTDLAPPARVVVRGRYPGFVKGAELDGRVFVRLDQGSQASYLVADVQLEAAS